MHSVQRWSTVGVAILATLSTAVPTTYRTYDGIDPNDFIHVDGLRLKDSSGRLHYLTGLNYW